MSDTRQDQLEDTSLVRQLIDALAAQLVLGDGSCPDEWLQEFAATLSRIGAAAELSGRPDLQHAAQDLQQRVARVRNGEGKTEELEPALRSGVTRLQEALDHAGSASGETAPQPPAGASLCAGHAQQLGGESPLPNLMEVKG
jgi:hypothetical protein